MNRINNYEIFDNFVPPTFLDRIINNVKFCHRSILDYEILNFKKLLYFRYWCITKKVYINWEIEWKLWLDNSSSIVSFSLGKKLKAKFVLLIRYWDATSFGANIKRKKLKGSLSIISIYARLLKLCQQTGQRKYPPEAGILYKEDGSLSHKI